MRLLYEHLVDDRLYQVWKMDNSKLLTAWVYARIVERWSFYEMKSLGIILYFKAPADATSYLFSYDPSKM